MHPPAQIAAAAGNWKRAAAALQAVPALAARSAVVATTATLLEAAGDVDAADNHVDAHLAALEAAAAAAAAAGGGGGGAGVDAAALHAVRLAAATFKERHGRHAAAAQLLERIVRSGGGVGGEEHVVALAGLVRCAAHVDVDAAEAHAACLPPMTGAAELDLEAVESGVGVLTAAAVRGKRVVATVEVEAVAAAGGAGKGQGKRKGAAAAGVDGVERKPKVS